MNWSRSIFSVIISFLIISCKKDVPEQIVFEYVHPHPTVFSVKELGDAIEEGQVKIIDFRKPDTYSLGHIENALNIWRSHITDTSYAYGGMMAKKEQLENLFSSLGINNDDTVVVYDNNGACDASRFWWVMQYYGFDNVKILDGGLDAWERSGRSITQKKPNIKRTKFKLGNTVKSNSLANKELIELYIKRDSGVVILDTRTIDEFSGKRKKIGATKGGRIPKSIHMDWVNAIKFDDDKTFKWRSDIKHVYDKLNIKKTDTIVVYCHSGVRSAHTYFVLKEILGYENVMNYDGSWTEWSYFNTLPYEKDSLTTIKK